MGREIIPVRIRDPTQKNGKIMTAGFFDSVARLARNDRIVELLNLCRVVLRHIT